MDIEVEIQSDSNIAENEGEGNRLKLPGVSKQKVSHKKINHSEQESDRENIESEGDQEDIPLPLNE